VIGEFRQFLTRTNALALAVGVIIGAATAQLVSAIASDVLMPIIGVFMPGGNWRDAKWPLDDQNAILYGHLLGAILDFVIIAWVVFLMTKWFLRPGPDVAMRTCPDCLELIPAAARRCRACTSTTMS
jgi:large conductance mechanosensitive channel